MTDNDSRIKSIVQQKSKLSKEDIKAIKDVVIRAEKEKKEQVTEIKKTINPNFGIAWTIWQEDFEEGQNVLQLDCGKTHIFHFSWLKEWMKFKFVWPSCRMSLQTLYLEKLKNNSNEEGFEER